MVEKIDKPEPKSVYFIDASPESADDRGKKNQQQKEGDEYSGSHAGPGWQKIYSSSMNRRYLKLRRENISRAWFQGTTMQRGISLAEIHVETRDGRIIKNAHIVLSQREDFWTLKKFQPGQEIPLNLIFKQPIVEISVPQATGRQVNNTSPSEQPAERVKSNRRNVINVMVLAIIGIAILTLLAFIVFK